MNSIENNIAASKATKVTFLKKVEIATRNPKNYRDIWWTILALTILIIGLAGATLGLIYHEPSQVASQVSAFSQYLLAAEILAFISIGLIVLPYLYLSGSWIAGVNNTSKGPIYQVFLWTCYIVAVLVALLAFILYWTMWINL